MNLSGDVFSTIAAFLRQIGLPVETGEIDHPTFLPGIHIDTGVLRVAPAKLLWPGDLLHEAGHLALLAGERRKEAQGDVGDDGGDELGAVAWSYAAAVHLRLDPAIVFHEGGYQGGGRSMLENFAEGRYLGLPMLQWRGLCLDEKNAAAAGVRPYPHMMRWLRE